MTVTQWNDTGTDGCVDNDFDGWATKKMYFPMIPANGLIGMVMVLVMKTIGYEMMSKSIR